MAKPQHRTAEHRRARKAIDQAQARGETLQCAEVECVLGTWIIYPDQAAVVAHNPSGTAIIGASHDPCNAHEAAVRGNKMRARPERWAL